MKAAALVVGILGSVAAFILSIGTVILGGLGDAFGIEGSGIVLILGWLMLLGSIAALVGALLAKSNPISGAMILGISAIPPLLLTFIGGVVMPFAIVTILLAIPAILAYLGAKQDVPA